MKVKGRINLVRFEETRKYWQDLIVSAAPLVAFLERDSYFDRAYSGDLTNKLFFTDVRLAIRYAVDELRCMPIDEREADRVIALSWVHILRHDKR